MIEGKYIRADVVVVLLLVAVVVGGLWMTGNTIDVKTSAIQTQLESVDNAVNQVSEQISDIRMSMGHQEGTVTPPVTPQEPDTRASANDSEEGAVGQVVVAATAEVASP